MTKDEPPIVSLSYANNAGSEINPENVSIVFNNDKTKFMLVGPTPIVNGTTQNLAELTNSSGSEFYYFSTNSEVKDTTGYVDPGTTYHLSPYSSLTTSSTKFNKNTNDHYVTTNGYGVENKNNYANYNIDNNRIYNDDLITYSNPLQNMTATKASDPSYYTAKEIWYDTPVDPIIIYATFMTPNNSDGVLTTDITYNDVIFSHSINIIPVTYRTDPSVIQMYNCVVPNSVVLIQCSNDDTLTTSNFNSNTTFLSTTSYFNKDDIYSAPGLGNIYCSIFYVGAGGGATLLNIQLPNSLTKIGNQMFIGQDSLTSITIPDSVISIGINAFKSCYSLTSVTIGSGVTSIGDSAFQGCSKNLESITVSSENTKYYSERNCLIDASTKTLLLGCKNSIIPTDGSVTSIGTYAFQVCSNLTSITIPDSVTSIGTDAFYRCSKNLESITVSSGNTKYSGAGNCLIDTSTKTLLLGCKNSIIPTDGSVTIIGTYAFQGCSNLTSITIPESVTSIGNYAFDGCSSLTSITIPESVTSIGRYAFQSCSNLTSATFENTSGWIVSTSSSFSSSTSLSSTDLANTSTAATYLRQYSSSSPSGYSNYYWKRS